MFAQFPMIAASSGEDISATENEVSDSPLSNYTELGDGQVMDILKRHIDNGSSVTDRLVLFKGAIEHSSRLCRAMVSACLFSIGNDCIMCVCLSKCVCINCVLHAEPSWSTLNTYWQQRMW